jgi:Lrp/AsnC family leucine-responsive transcriptional regulator
VNLSPSACHRRVQRLEEEGFIAGYVALLDARRMGRMTTVFVEITLQSQAKTCWTPSSARSRRCRIFWNVT